jgi:beta-N-acetylhexosaminidase
MIPKFFEFKFSSFAFFLRQWHSAALRLLICFFGFCHFSSSAQHPCVAPNEWADSVLKTMTLDEKIGQLFMLSVPIHNDTSTSLAEQIQKYKPGGIIFFKGTPYNQAVQTNFYQSLSTIPLMTGIDGEWGLAMRLDSVPAFTKQMQLGAMQNDSLVMKMGLEVGRQCRRLGINVNFAPDVDINNNPMNPVIGDRSFGEEPDRVARYSLAYSRGMQAYHVMACAKHFPGHGDVTVDSHKDLPIINKSEGQLDSLELLPFKMMRDSGIMSMMVAHIHMGAFDSLEYLPATLSPAIIKDLLRDKMKFDGLVFTDAMNMKGVTKYFMCGDAEWLALKAGADVLLCVDDPGPSIASIKCALDGKMISENEIDEHVLRILKAKQWCGLDRYQPVVEDCITEDLNNPYTKKLLQQMAESSVCIVKNEQQLLPLVSKKQKIALLVIGGKKNSYFPSQLRHYTRMDAFSTDKNFSAAEINQWMKKLAPYDLVIISIQGTSRFLTRNYGITETESRFVNALCKKKKTIVVNFSNAYGLAKFDDARNVVEAFEETEQNMLAAAQIIFGLKPSLGSLPVNIDAAYRLHQSVSTTSFNGLKYSSPEDVGLDSRKLQLIDSLAIYGIKQKAYPGCQVLVAKNGMICYEESFGTFTYESDSDQVFNSDLFDLASVTKVAATTLAVMKLYDEKKIDLNQKLSFYLPDLKTTNKKNITVKQVLLHEAGLKAWIPFYIEALKDSTVFSKDSSSQYSIQVADSMFMRADYTNVIWKTIYQSPVTPPGRYVYSDLDFIFLKKLVEKITATDFERYLSTTFYDPLELTTTCFNPLRFYNKEEIAPTQDDKTFRKQVLQGYVHDPAAAMFGGVSGHAGLFSNAYDLAVIFEMLLNKGTYNGIKYFNPQTVTLFTSYQSATSRRGLGFDKQRRKPTDPEVMYNGASTLTFGHTGFTGISVWADPKYNLVFVFLSNRVYPDQENDKIIRLSIRSRIQKAIYDAMKQ